MISGVTRPIRSMTSRREKYAIAPMSFTAMGAVFGRCASTHLPRWTCIALMFWTADPRQRRRLVDAAEPPDEAALDLGRRGGGIRRADRREAEQARRRQEHDRHDDEHGDPADRQRACDDEEDQQQERLGPRQHRE